MAVLFYAEFQCGVRLSPVPAYSQDDNFYMLKCATNYSVKVDVKMKKYRDCFECGGKCCKFLSVPEEYRRLLNTRGVPVDLYAFDLDPDPRRYFEIHEGVTLIANRTRFIVAKNIRTRIMDTQIGKQIIIYSRCTKLDENSRCIIYEDRPVTCRIFDESTVELFSVPLGCIYDFDESGEISVCK